MIQRTIMCRLACHRSLKRCRFPIKRNTRSISFFEAFVYALSKNNKYRISNIHVHFSSNVFMTTGIIPNSSFLYSLIIRKEGERGREKDNRRGQRYGIQCSVKSHLNMSETPHTVYTKKSLYRLGFFLLCLIVKLLIYFR